MKICIEATPIGIKTTDRGGVYRYISSLIEGLSAIDHRNEYTLFYNFFRREHARFFRENTDALKVGDNFSVRISRFPNRLQRIMEPPAELLAGRFDVFHGCFDHLRPILSGKGVVTIHDIRYLEEIDDPYNSRWIDIIRASSPTPDFHINDLLNRQRLFSHLRADIKKTIGRSAIVITVSEFSKKRIIDKLGTPPEKVRVIYHGVDRQFVPQGQDAVKNVLQKYRITAPYVLYTGKFEPLKNIERILEAFQKVAFRADIRLVMAGPVNWFYYVVRRKVSELKIEDRVVFTDFVPNDEMAGLYSGASVFVSPSLYEGFGLPLLEAMACGVPVVTSNICSIPEVVGDAAVFADPYSADDIAGAVTMCLENEGLRADLVRKGMDRVRSFTWEDTARRTLRVYSEICR